MLECTQKVNLISTQFTFFNGFHPPTPSLACAEWVSLCAKQRKSKVLLSQLPHPSRALLRTHNKLKHETNEREREYQHWNHLRFIYSDLSSCVLKLWYVFAARRVEFIYFSKLNFSCIEICWIYCVGSSLWFSCISLRLMLVAPHKFDDLFYWKWMRVFSFSFIAFCILLWKLQYRV